MTQKDSETPCGAQHCKGSLCARQYNHRGDHMAYDDSGNVVRSWRGGRPHWAKRDLTA